MAEKSSDISSMIISNTRIIPASETNIAISSLPDRDNIIYAVLTNIPIPAVFKIRVISTLPPNQISISDIPKPEITDKDEYILILFGISIRIFSMYCSSC